MEALPPSDTPGWSSAASGSSALQQQQQGGRLAGAWAWLMGGGGRQPMGTGRRSLHGELRADVSTSAADVDLETGDGAVSAQQQPQLAPPTLPSQQQDEHLERRRGTARVAVAAWLHHQRSVAPSDEPVAAREQRGDGGAALELQQRQQLPGPGQREPAMQAVDPAPLPPPAV